VEKYNSEKLPYIFGKKLKLKIRQDLYLTSENSFGSGSDKLIYICVKARILSIGRKRIHFYNLRTQIGRNQFDLLGPYDNSAL
jgi:hypothetical protein